MTLELHHYIGGQWRSGAGAHTVNLQPARPTEASSEYNLATDADVDAALSSGKQSFDGWRRTPMHERARILLRTAELIERDLESLAELITVEQGKAIATSRGEVGRAAGIFRYFSHDADSPTGSLYASPRRGERILTDRGPIGQILCITPWNVPIAIPAWKLAPALAHGNTVLWKPSPVTPAIAMRLVRLLEEAGLPSGVVNLFLGTAGQAEAALRDPRIKGCTFTGSTAVGRHLMAVGAKCGIDVLAEMGGKNAAIVLADADLPWAASQITAAAMEWSGQRCTATSRVIVESAVADEFTGLLAEVVAELPVGDPMDPVTKVGPVATKHQFDSIANMLTSGIESGAAPIVGGIPRRSSTDGYFVAPTLLTGVSQSNVLFTNEVFGPVAAIVTAESVEDAFTLANQGTYGLSGSLFTASIDRALMALDEFDIGILHINSESTGADPHVPFGGFGDSGSHHKEMGELARDFFTKTRTVYLRGSRS
jgi:alpha-ketoglutaric semialdehyde dehydrogenase